MDCPRETSQAEPAAGGSIRERVTCAPGHHSPASRPSARNRCYTGDRTSPSRAAPGHKIESHSVTSASRRQRTSSRRYARHLDFQDELPERVPNRALCAFVKSVAASPWCARSVMLTCFCLFAVDAAVFLTTAALGRAATGRRSGRLEVAGRRRRAAPLRCTAGSSPGRGNERPAGRRGDRVPADLGTLRFLSVDQARARRLVVRADGPSGRARRP